MGGEFEEAFAAAHGASFGVTATSGTAAIEIALRAAGLQRGDEVIVPALTFYATAFAALVQGFKPVFCDIDPDTWCIDPEQIERLITPRTRAIVPVHLGSRMADMDRIGEIARKHRLAVIEDCAHAHGMQWNGRHAGTFGDAGCFSFQTSKLMTCGEGGIIVTNDAQMEERCRGYMNSGRVRTKDRAAAEGTMLGWNYRMTEFQAAVLRVQLERLPEQTRVREANKRYLTPDYPHLDRIPDRAGSLTRTAGDYTIYTLPGDAAFSLIINGETNLFHTEYRANRDVGRVPMTLTRPSSWHRSASTSTGSSGGRTT